MPINDRFVSFFSIFSLLFTLAPFFFIIYIFLQFLRAERERNDLLNAILEELRKKDSRIL